MNIIRKRYAAVALFLVLLLFVSIGLAVAFCHKSIDEPSVDEPSFNGLSLTAWLQKYIDVGGRDAGFPGIEANNNECRKAVRAMATNAIPCLLIWIQREDLPTRKQMISALNRVLPAKHKILLASDWNQLGGLGFNLLEKDGQSAIPALIELTKNDNPKVRLEALACLWLVDANNQILLPLIERLQNDPDKAVQMYAKGLAVELQFRPKAESTN